MATRRKIVLALLLSVGYYGLVKVMELHSKRIDEFLDENFDDWDNLLGVVDNY